MAKKQQTTADGDMLVKMQKMAEQASTWNNEIPQGTEVAAIQDDGSRRIMWVSGPAMVGNDGVQAVLCANPPERKKDESGVEGFAFTGEELMFPINRIRKRAVETRRAKDLLRVELTDEERLEMGDKLADLYQQSTVLDGELSQAKKQIQGKIEAVKNTIESTVNLLRAGYEIRGVQVETVRDFDLQTVIKRRKDSGAIIERRALREDEMTAETSLFPELHQEPETPAEADQDAEQEEGAESSGSSEATAEPEVLDVGEAEIAKAIEILRETKRASVSGLQRRLNVGFIRAAQIMEALEVRGIVGPAKGGGTRDIIEGALEASAESDESSEG